MKAFALSVFLLLFSLGLAFPAPAGAAVHVRGSVTHRGVYRQPHQRTAPNHTQHDNWSTKGNVNPYTGKAGRKRARR